MYPKREAKLKIVLISGKARHGKTAVAELLMKELTENNKVVDIVYFSDHIKKIAILEHGWNGEKDENGRRLLQNIGMDKRNINQDYWTDIVLDIIEKNKHRVDFILIPDVRFKREIEIITAKFGLMAVNLRVVRENFENNLTSEQKDHPSEVDLDDCSFDYIIKSVEGINNLEREVKIVARLFS